MEIWDYIVVMTRWIVYVYAFRSYYLECGIWLIAQKLSSGLSKAGYIVKSFISSIITEITLKW